jgi:hypothetical protein
MNKLRRPWPRKAGRNNRSSGTSVTLSAPELRELNGERGASAP